MLYWNILTNCKFCTGISLLSLLEYPDLTEYFVLEYFNIFKVLRSQLRGAAVSRPPRRGRIGAAPRPGRTGSNHAACPKPPLLPQEVEAGAGRSDAGQTGGQRKGPGHEHKAGIRTAADCVARGRGAGISYWRNILSWNVPTD